MKNAVHYTGILAVFSLVIVYQMKSSLDTVRVERTLEFFVPFTFQPFTNRIDYMAYVSNWEEGALMPARPTSFLHRGDEILSVNGHAFRGLSDYLRTLEYDRWVHPNSGWHGFAVTARLADSTVHRVDFGFPHCTCGVPTLAQAVSVWVVPPVFCVVLGFVAVLCRPRTRLSWGFLCALLALSQAQFWDDVSPGFWSVTTAPMAWSGWFRLFGVAYRALAQSLWPAALLLASTHFYRRRRRAVALAVGLSALFLMHALLRVVLQVAWSENYRPFVTLYRFFDSYETGFVAAAFIVVAGLSWTLSRPLGIGASYLALIAVIAIYWSAPPVTHGEWVRVVDGTQHVVFDVPTVHNTPALAIALYTGGMFVLALVVFRRRISFLETLGFSLLLPILVDFTARAGLFWNGLDAGFFPYWYSVASASAGIGLACLFWSIVKRTRNERFGSGWDTSVIPH